MYVIELYDADKKKMFIKEFDPKGYPSVLTKKKTEAILWREKNQAIMYATKLMTDSVSNATSGRPNLILGFIGFRVIRP